MKILSYIKDFFIFLIIKYLKSNLQMDIIEELDEKNFNIFIKENPNFNLQEEIDDFCKNFILQECTFVNNKILLTNSWFDYRGRNAKIIKKIQKFSNIKTYKFFIFEKKFFKFFKKTNDYKIIFSEIQTRKNISIIIKILKKI